MTILNSYRQELDDEIKRAEENVADVTRQLGIVTDRLNTLKSKRDAVISEADEYSLLKIEKAAAIELAAALELENAGGNDESYTSASLGK